MKHGEDSAHSRGILRSPPPFAPALAQAQQSTGLARAALDAANPAALPLVAAASYDCLRLAVQLAVWRPPSGRRGGRIVAVCDQLEQAGGRGLAISAGRGRPGEGAEVVAALQYALYVLTTLV